MSDLVIGTAVEDIKAGESCVLSVERDGASYISKAREGRVYPRGEGHSMVYEGQLVPIKGDLEELPVMQVFKQKFMVGTQIIDVGLQHLPEGAVVRKVGANRWEITSLPEGDHVIPGTTIITR